MGPPHETTVDLANEASTLALGSQLAAALKPGMIVFLSGELGSGKTTLVRGMLRKLGYAGRVKSPTFSLVEVYSLSSLYLHHFDFYRFKQTSEWLETGFRDMFEPAAVCLVEWPEKGGDTLPQPDLHIRLVHTHPGRRATITACTDTGVHILEKLTMPSVKHTGSEEGRH